MSLVKKMQTGGSAKGAPSQGTSFDEYLAKRLDETKFTAKGEKEARDAASQFSKLHNLAEFKDVYSYDPIKHEYHINTDKITDPTLKSMEWGGSKDDINRNLLGAYSGQGDRSNKGDVNAPRKKYNSLVASIYNDWNVENAKTGVTGVNTPGTQPIRTFAANKSFKPLEDYMLNQEFGGNEEARNNAISSLTDDNARKALIAKYAKNHATQYLQDYAQNKNTDKFTGVENAQALQDITSKIDLTKPIDDATWTNLVGALNKTGSNPTGLLLTSGQKTEIAAKTAADANTLKVKDLIGKYTGAGITDPNTQQALAASGYTEIDDAFSPDKNAPWFGNLMKQQGVKAVKNPTTGDYKLLKNNQLWNYTPGATEEGKGYSWENTMNAPFKWNAPKPIPSINPTVAVDAILKNPQSVLSSLPSDVDHYGSLPALKQALESQKTMMANDNHFDSREMTRIAVSLRKQLKDNPSNSELLPLYDDLEKLTKTYEGIKFHKDGGVLKLVDGGTPYDKYLTDHNIKVPTDVTDTTVAPIGKHVSDVHGTFAGNTAFGTGMDALSTAGLVTSFIPGVGTLGAATTFGADLAKDIEQGGMEQVKENLGSHAINLGFIGLSFFGLGGLKGLLKAGKVGKEALTGIKELGVVANSLRDTEGIKSVALLTDKLGIKSLEDAKEVVKLLGVEKTEEVSRKLTELAPKIADFTDVPKFDKILQGHVETAEALKDATTKVMGSMTLGKVAKKIGSADWEGTLGTIAKTAKYGIAGATAASGISAGVDTFKAIKDDGWEHVKPEDIKRIAMTASLVGNLRQELQTVKAIKNQTTRSISTGDKTVFKIGGEEVEVPGLIPLETTEPKSLIQRGKSIFSKAPTEAEITANTETSRNALRDKLASAYEKAHGVLSPEQKAAINIDKVEHVIGESSGQYILGKGPMSTSSDRGINVRDYNLAKKVLNRNKLLGTESTPIEELKKLKNQAVISTIAPVNIPTPIVTIPPIVVKPPRVYKPGSQKATMAAYKANMQTPPKKKDGGILKFQTPAGPLKNTTLYGGSTVNLDIAPKLAGNLYYGPMKKYTDAKDWRFTPQGKYTDVYTNAISSLDEPWYQANKGRIQDAVTKSGSSYKLPAEGGLKEVRRLATDYKPGVLHDISLVNPPVTPSTISPVNSVVPTIPGMVGTPGMAPNSTFTEIPYTPKKYFDPTRFTNLTQFLNTYSANKAIARDQRAAATEIPVLQTAPLTYMRTGIPNIVNAQTQSTKMTDMGKRAADATSDWGRGFSAQLSTASKVGDIMNRGQQADLQANYAIKNAETNTNANINRNNLGIINQNRTIAAGARQKLNLINASERGANANAVNLVMNAEAMAWPRWQYKRGLFDLQNQMENPNIEATSKFIQNSMSPEREKVYRDNYETMNAGKNVDKIPWEQSEQYRALQDEIKSAQGRMEKYTRPIMSSQARLRTQEPTLYMAKGGGMSTEEKIELDREQVRERKNLKEYEIFHSTVLKNNELLEKSLIKIFK